MTKRTLILVRHADALGRASRDMLRELSTAGRAQARELGRLLAVDHRRVDVAAVSAATRARQTFEELTSSLDVAASWTDEIVYEARTEDLIDLARSFTGGVGLIVGHAPTIGETGWALACDDDREFVSWSVPTATAIIVSFEGVWSDLREGACRARILHSSLRAIGD